MLTFLKMGLVTSFLAAIARQAARAPRQELTILLALSLLGAAAAALTARLWPALAVATVALSAATALLALWELCRRSTIMVSAQSRAIVLKGLAVLGVLLWFLGGMALVVALLGDPWQL